jgi:hypothetical protein
MNNLLIGYTGFVGSNLDHSKYEVFINSKNYQSIENQTFDHVMCCGFSGTKYIANKNPIEDWNKIKQLLETILTIQCNKFTLISTIDVYFDHAYGKHRKKIEEVLKDYFSETLTIVRLPGIYGKNLKKNAIYDLMHNHNLDQISLKDQYQWYSLFDLESDIASNMDKKIIELFPEPILIEEINDSIFKFDTGSFSTLDPTKHYDNKPYIYSKELVLKKIKRDIPKIR